MRVKSSNARMLIMIALLMVSIPACKGKTTEPATGDQPAAVETGEAKKGAVETPATGEEGALAESDEDLLAVDYKEFYDDLAPHGKWVEMSAKDLGFVPQKSASAIQPRPILDRIFGVREAFAQVSASVEAEAVFVWQPSVTLAVSAEATAAAAAEVTAAAAATAPVQVEAAVEAEAYMPYENGEWTYTDAGWYFHAATPAEEITSHYGRWTFTAGLGWVWLPGTVWAPAWVDWREDDTYIAWTPVPPHVYISGDVLVAPPVLDIGHYVVVEKKHFLEPAVYKYMYNVKVNPNKIMIKTMVKKNGVMVKGKAVYNLGPDFAHVEKVTGKKIEMVKINKMGHKGMVKYSAKEFDVYTPSFKKAKHGASIKGSISKPKAFVKFDDAKAAYKAELSLKAKGPKGIKEGEMKGGKGVAGFQGAQKGGAGAKFEAGYAAEAKGGGKGSKGKPAGGGKAGAGASFGFGASAGGGSVGGVSVGGKASGGGKAAGGGKASGGGKAAGGGKGKGKK